MIFPIKRPSEEPEGELRLLSADRRVLMVFALDIESEALAPAISSLTRRFRRHKLVFVHSSLDFRPFMTEKVAFEHVPGLDQIAAFPDLVDWPRFLEDCRALLVTKWAPRRAIAYGLTFPAYIARAEQIVNDVEVPEASNHV